ncbi:MAG: hypothetical protein GYA55_04750, partial [SAR324 cluster bacterium]|nr:hypothetical protein [SAR324 cluster bacterium]
MQSVLKNSSTPSSAEAKDFVLSPEERQIRESQLAFIARSVGDDPKMEVSLGPAGAGNGFDLVNSRIVIDVLDALGSWSSAVFTAGHEGAHRLLSPRLFELPFSSEKIEEFFQETGFQSTYNVIEDCAVNDGMVRKYPGIEGPTRETYRDQNLESGLLSTPEIVSWCQQNGGIPKFAKALSTMLGYWATHRLDEGFASRFSELKIPKEFSEHPDPEVAFILKRIF